MTHPVAQQLLRSFQNSATARAAGFSTVDWLRAFTFSEHVARIERSLAITEREICG